MFDVSTGAVRSRMRLLGIRREGYNLKTSQRLTDEEERQVVEHITELITSKGQPPRLADVEAAANDILTKRDEPCVARGYGHKFVKRHPALKELFMKTERYNKPRRERRYGYVVVVAADEEPEIPEGFGMYWGNEWRYMKERLIREERKREREEEKRKREEKRREEERRKLASVQIKEEAD